MYIGVHCEKQWPVLDGYLGSGCYLKRAVKKHGKDAFQRKILVVSNNREYILMLEREYVSRDFIAEDTNYNVRIGGVHKGHVRCSIETREKISRALKGKKASVVTRLKQSRAQKGKKRSEAFKENLRNREYTVQHRQRISDAQRGEGNNNHKGWYHTPLDIFPSLEGQSKITPKTLKRWCCDNNRIITKRSYLQSKYLQELGKNIVGKTFKEVGFRFEPRK